MKLGIVEGAIVGTAEGIKVGEAVGAFVGTEEAPDSTLVGALRWYFRWFYCGRFGWFF
jgi:hypothetical protein